MNAEHIYTVNEVVAALDQFHGHTLQVTGAFRLHFEDHGMWHLPATERHPGRGSSLWVSFDRVALLANPPLPEQIEDRPVVVTAVVDRYKRGHYGLWPGSLFIQRITVVPDAYPT